MNRLEEIRERLSYFPRELQDGGFSENSLEYGARLDIEYLLQRLETAQKAFEKILREDVRKRLNDEDLAPRYREIAIIALKSLNEQ